MADETIIIEIKDGIDNSIVAKINGIAKAARTAHSEISGFAKQFDSLNKAAAAISKLELANERLAAATHRADAAALGAAVNEQRLAAARARTAAETSKAAQAALRLSEAQSRAAERAAKAAAAQKAAADAASNQAKQFDRAGISVKQYSAAMRGVPAQITDIVVSLQGGQAPLTVLLQQGGQLKDMFGGIRPAAAALTRGLIAMINPFTLLAAAAAGFAFAVGNVEGKMRALNGLTAQFVATGRSDINQTFIAQLSKEISELPGVSKEASMQIISEFAKIRTITVPVFKEATKQVTDLAVALGVEAHKAAEILAEGLADPLKGAIELDKRLGFLTAQNFKTIDSLVKLGKTSEAQRLILSLLDREIGGLARDSMTPLQRATDDLGNAWNRFISTLGNSSVLRTAANGLAGLVDGLTWIIDKLDRLFSMKVPPWILKGMAAIPGGGITAGLFNSTDTGIPNSEPRSIRGPSQTASTDSKLIAAGLKKAEGASAAESRAAAIAKINLQLQNELTLLEMLGDEREKQEMFDRIEESLAGRRIKLNDEETASIRNQIERIVEMNSLSAERNRIYNEAISPLREYNTGLKAAQELYADGVISVTEYNKQIALTEQNYQRATNPLYEFSQGLSDELKLTRFLGVAYEDNAQLQRVMNDLRSRGINISEGAREALMQEIILVRERNALHAAENNLINQSVTARQQQATQIQALAALTASGKGGFTAGDSANATSGILQQMGFDPSTLQVGLEAQLAQIKTYYDQIAQMRASNLIGEQDAAKLQSELWVREQQARFAQTRQFFTGLEGLQNSNSKKLQTIGKAAAISKAIIDTYTSATGAYSAMASIPYVGPALGAAAAAAAIAAGMANVQAIRSQGSGFKSGGYTGDYGVNTAVGPVHGREFVFDAPAVDRIGVENLEAMRKGKTDNIPTVNNNSSTSTQQNLKIINVLDREIIGDFLSSPEGEQTFVNAIRRNGDAVRSVLNNA